MEIIPNVHLIPGIIANPYLLIDPQGLTLIDAGMPGSEKKILRYINELGYASAALKRIIITHADFDHVGGLAGLKAATGARVFANAGEAEAIKERRSSRELKPRSVFGKLLFGLMGRLFKAKAVKVDEYLQEGTILPVMGGLQVLDTFGHTPGHVSLYATAGKVLFCGDSIVVEKYGMRGSRGSNNWDQAKADASVRKQAALGAEIVCPGHGAVVREAEGKFPKV